MNQTRQKLINYVNAASDLAETLKNNVKRSAEIESETVIALNKFIIAANEISDLTEELNRINMKFN